MANEKATHLTFKFGFNFLQLPYSFYAGFRDVILLCDLSDGLVASPEGFRDDVLGPI